MAEAVIVATSRTAIGRAGKGGLVEARPDDLSAFVIEDVLGKVPDLPRDQIEDVIGVPLSRAASRATTWAGLQRYWPAWMRRAPLSTGTARRRCRRFAWPPTLFVPARVMPSFPVAWSA